MDKIIIGVSGKKRHGKDTVADYLVENYGFKKLVLADVLKNAIKVLFGMSDEQLWGDKKEIKDEFWGYSPREIMQILGTDLIREQFDKDFFTKSIKRDILNSSHDRFVISDVRFKNELEMINSIGGTVIRITRDIENKDEHVSEKDLDDIDLYTIENRSSIEDLHKKIDTFLLQYAHIEKK